MKKVVFLIVFALTVMTCGNLETEERESPEERTEILTVQESSDVMRSRK